MARSSWRQPIGTTGGTDSLLRMFQEREAAALKANEERKAKIEAIYNELISQYETGGAFKTAGLADIEKAKAQAIGSGTQQMISSGMYGTTTAASIPMRAEAEAGQQRLKLEDLLQQRVSEAKLGLAGFTERIDTPYPDYSMLMQAMMAQGSQSGQQPMSYGGGGGAPRPQNYFDYMTMNRMQPGSTAKEQARYAFGPSPARPTYQPSVIQQMYPTKYPAGYTKPEPHSWVGSGGQTSPYTTKKFIPHYWPEG